MTFEVIPAIDLRGGRCVRLFQGDYDRETEYSLDPAAMALHWEDLGAARLHVVDLDGARSGRPENGAAIAAICAVVGVPVEVSGGIRTMAALSEAVAFGAERIQLGSAAVSNPEFLVEALSRYPGMVVVSIDARDGEVVTDGWLNGTGRRPLDFAREVVAFGVPRIMYTDVRRDGALTEPNFGALRDMVEAVSAPVVAAGGVAKVEHLVRLAEIGCEGAIVGKALYQGAVELPAALAAVRMVAVPRQQPEIV